MKILRETKNVIQIELPRYRILTKMIGVRTNYLLQELRIDATLPYYLTVRIYFLGKRARTALEYVMTTGKLPKRIITLF